MKVNLASAVLAGVCVALPSWAAEISPVVSLVSGDKTIPLSPTPALFAKASGIVLRLTMNQAGKATTISKAGKLTFLVESKDKPGPTFRLVRFEWDDKKGRIVTMGSSKLSPAKDIEYPAPDVCVEFEAVSGEKPGTWRLTPKKELLKGEYGLYIYHSRGFSFDAIKADLFDFAVE
jgi:hypothetical protein